MSVANKTVLDTFGRVVARAWRESSGGERLMVGTWRRAGAGRVLTRVCEPQSAT